MNRLSFVSALPLGLALAALALPGVAEAVPVDCPGVYSIATPTECDGDTTAALNPICWLDAGNNVICDLEANYAGTYVGPTSSKYVTPIANGTEFLAYGTDAIGNPFCCQLVMAAAGQCSRTLVVNGSGTADTIHLDDPAQGWDMTCSHSTVWGSDDVDSIYGSKVVNNYDFLNGESSADTIYGGIGDDHIDGGVSADILMGGAGNDTIYGDNGNDQIKGGDGVDTIYGEADDDTICGEAGDDYLYGDDGENDIVVSGPGTDPAIEGGPGPHSSGS